MVTVKNEEAAPTRTIDARRIPAGTAFRGKIGLYGDRLFIKAYRDIVSLNDVAGGVWDDPDFTVEEYEPVDITITVEGPAK